MTLRNWARLILIGSALFINLLFINFITISAIAADTIMVTLGQDQKIQISARVATVVIGNPLFADVTVTSGNVMVITGKGYGTTNLILFDRAGAALMEKSVTVRAPDDLLVVHCAVPRQSLSCNPICEASNLLGDSACVTGAKAESPIGAPSRTVFVRGYTRQDGAQVDGYSRSAPGQGSEQSPAR